MRCIIASKRASAAKPQIHGSTIYQSYGFGAAVVRPSIMYERYAGRDCSCRAVDLCQQIGRLCLVTPRYFYAWGGQRLAYAGDAAILTIKIYCLLPRCSRYLKYSERVLHASPSFAICPTSAYQTRLDEILCRVPSSHSSSVRRPNESVRDVLVQQM